MQVPQKTTVFKCLQRMSHHTLSVRSMRERLKYAVSSRSGIYVHCDVHTHGGEIYACLLYLPECPLTLESLHTTAQGICEELRGTGRRNVCLWRYGGHPACMDVSWPKSTERHLQRSCIYAEIPLRTLNVEAQLPWGDLQQIVTILPAGPAPNIPPYPWNLPFEL